MNFWKKFLFNLALYIIGFTIIYFIAPDLWNTGFQIVSTLIGTGLTIFFSLCLLFWVLCLGKDEEPMFKGQRAVGVTVHRLCQSSHRLEKTSRTTMIHSKACGLTRVSAIRATQMPRGMKRKTHHSENRRGRSSTPV